MNDLLCGLELFLHYSQILFLYLFNILIYSKSLIKILLQRIRELQSNLTSKIIFFKFLQYIYTLYKLKERE